jgi:Homeodomain
MSSSKDFHIIPYDPSGLSRNHEVSRPLERSLEERAILKSAYRHNLYHSEEEKAEIARRLQQTNTQVDIWFCNKRRTAPTHRLYDLDHRLRNLDAGVPTSSSEALAFVAARFVHKYEVAGAKSG